MSGGGGWGGRHDLTSAGWLALIDVAMIMIEWLIEIEYEWRRRGDVPDDHRTTSAVVTTPQNNICCGAWCVCGNTSPPVEFFFSKNVSGEEAI